MGPLLVALDFTCPAHGTSPGGGHHEDWGVRDVPGQGRVCLRGGVILVGRRWSRGSMRISGNVGDIDCWRWGNRSKLRVDEVLGVVGLWSIGEGPGGGEGGR